MRTAALATFLSAIVAFSLAGPAFADDPPPLPPPAPQPAPQPAPPAPAPAPKPKRQKGAISLEVLGGMVPAGGTRAYVLDGDLVTVIGHVKPFLPRQKLKIRITGAHGKRTTIRTTVRKARGEGRFTIRFRPKAEANYEIYVRH